MKTIVYRILRNIPLLNYAIHKLLGILEYFYFYDKVYDARIRKRMQSRSFYPSELVFMVTNLCNSDCIMCPHRKFREMNPEGKKILSMELFRKAIDESVGFNVNQVVFTGGEPLLDPHLYERISYAKNMLHRSHCLLFTNGSFLHYRDNIHKLLDSPLDSITVSLDATCEEEYSRVRKNLSFSQLIANIEELYSNKKKRNKAPLIRLSFLALEANVKSKKEFFKKLQGYADVMEINNPHNFGGLVDVKADYAYPKVKRYPCRYLWTRFTIPPSGNISVCGFDFLQQNVIGNLHDGSIKEFWVSPKMNKARTAHMNRNFKEVSVCSECTSHVSWWKEYII